MLPLACVLATVFAVIATVLALTKKLTARQRWSPREKTIVLTGASSGIGSSLARTYAAQGAKLYLVARRREALEAACEECMAAGASSAKAVVADVSSESGWDAIRSAIGDDTVDLLVLNAGLSMGSPFASLSERKEAMGIMKHLMDVNYMGSVGVLDACLGAMRQAEGGVRLLVVSSVVGLVAPPTRTGYAASKFALKGFFNALRVELGMSEQVPPTITLAYPGAVKTNINRARLRGGVDGGSGAVDLELDKSMSADRCASIMVRAHAAGCRDVYYSIDGTRVGAVKTRLLRHLAFFFPAGADKVLAKSIGAMSKSRRQVKGLLKGVAKLVIASSRFQPTPS